ncbi:MAG: hypothetical protein Q7U98_20340 [Methylicorpusculum sp.]|uniref:hypothetical protein n=1 Tax=Methylicorpusculum sp. TaxID=2713644 RepID=UPI00271DD560|nr:hypothetical protein [Methylicorpusculum sp.]MDO8941515.1 hypothetical protein [Methylicorpusculum sp.]
MNEQNQKKLEIAKLATQLTAALLESGKFTDFDPAHPPQAGRAADLLQVFDAIYNHLLGKIDT